MSRAQDRLERHDADVGSAPANPAVRVDSEGLAWIVFDDPERPVNVLTEGVMRRLSDALEEVRELATASQIRAVVFFSGKPASFIVGADVEAIGEIDEPSEGERASRLGQAIFDEVERLPVPTVAAIHGTCLGGGTELSLACRFRVVSDHPRTKIGLPEVQLGILPAWGGTTRLPRLIGLQAALGMLLTGNTVSASRAERIGLASEVLPHQTFESAVREFALASGDRSEGDSRNKPGLFSRLLEATPPGRRLVLAKARRDVMSRTRGRYPAPLAILDVLKRTGGRSVGEGLRAEAEAAGELISSRVSKNLIHVFQLREQAKKRPAGVDPGAEPRTVEHAAVVGAGVMGGGIAQLMAYNDIRIRMKDIRHEAVAGGLQHARALFDKAVEKRKLRRAEADRKMDLVSGGLEYHGFASADLVVEAVVEKMDVKRSVLAEVEGQVGGECVLATNTSSLSVDAMAEALERPERFGGMHFFNPVHKMPLVEVVRGARTDDTTVLTLHRLTLDLGKVPVVCQDGPGFLVNRILGPYLNEAGWLLADGATMEEIEGAARDFGMPMGPLRLVDEVGIDVSRHAGETLHEAFGERMKPAAPLVALGETDRLGRKGGLGFYRYEGGKEKELDQDVYQALAPAVPAVREGITSDRIRARLFFTMVNEAARALEDGIVASAGDVDLGMIMGTGFPPFRGGLLRYADEIGARTIVLRLRELAERRGPRFDPAPVLVELAERDGTFYKAYPDRRG